MRTLAAPSVQGHGLPPSKELWPYQSLFFEPLVAGNQKASLASFFSAAPPVQALRGLPCLGSFSVVQCLRHIEGRLLSGVLFCWYIPDSMEGDVLLTSTYSSTILFSSKHIFLQVSASHVTITASHKEQTIAMKGFSACLDMRRYKNWTNKIGF